MLRRTFLHLDGIGETTERKLWKTGILTWDDLLKSYESSSGKRKGVRAQSARESIRHYETGLWSFFDQSIPTRHKWRAFGDLSDHVLYVDIETTGVDRGDVITMIGTYDGKDFKAFIKGQNLQDAEKELERYPLIVTFNGACFDLPMIRKRFPYILFNHIHVDLRYPLRLLGFSGGLKHIEKRLNINRSADTEGLDGWDAVRLWREYKQGSEEALQLLVRYNEEDVRNMRPLMEFTFQQHEARLSSP